MLRHRLAIALLAAAVAAPGLAYTIVLKDGSQIIARERYQVQGRNAVIMLPNGVRTSLAMSEIDQAATKKANVSGDYGDAVVLRSGGDTATLPTPPSDTAPGTSLSQVAAQRRLADRRERPPAPTPPPPSDTGGLPRTPAGYVDLLRAPREPLRDIDLGNLVSRVLRARGLDGVSIYKGTRPGRLLLEFVANSEASVFEAVRISAEALVQLVDQGSADVEAFELFMATDRRVRGGQFLLTPEVARELTEKRVDLPTFFVRYVEF